MTAKTLCVCYLAATSLQAQRPRTVERVPPRTPNAAEERIGAAAAVRVHSTDEQRDQVRTCDRMLEVANASLKHLLDLVGNAQRPTGDMTLLGSQVRDQIGSLTLEHDKLIAGLDKTQKEELKTRVRDMARAQDHVTASLKKLSAELAKSKPDRARITELAGDMEKEMTAWQQQYRGLQSDLEP